MEMTKFFDESKVLKAMYNPLIHTFELTMQNIGTTIQVPLTINHFPKHPAIKFLDEYVQIYEDVNVILKKETELKLQGWKESEAKKGLINKSKQSFFIGTEKRKLLGNVYKAKIGITEKFMPYIFLKDFRFSPNEVRCIIKANDISLPSNPKGEVLSTSTASGTYTFDPIHKYLITPTREFHNPNQITDLLSFLRRAKLI